MGGLWIIEVVDEDCAKSSRFQIYDTQSSGIELRVKRRRSYGTFQCSLQLADVAKLSKNGLKKLKERHEAVLNRFEFEDQGAFTLPAVDDALLNDQPCFQREGVAMLAILKIFSELAVNSPAGATSSQLAGHELPHHEI